MLTGNWSGVTRKLEGLQKELTDGMRETTAQSAALVESTVLGHLKHQDLGWQSLSPAYLRWKLHHKGRGSRRLSEKILIATATYFQSITTSFSTIDKGLKAFVGIKRGVAREKDGADVVDIASVHEFGSPKNNIPARPLWQPTLKETEPKIKKLFQEKLKDLLQI